ncbi:MAG TPA: hypothetical protein VGO93_12655 [Candidatus Xenobia bacterium]
MRKTREILRLKLAEGRSNREVGRSCRVSPSKVCDVMGRFAVSGLSWPLPDDVDDKALDLKLYPRCAGMRTSREPEWAEVHAEMKRHKHLTLMQSWQEYKEREPEGLQYSRFCELYHEFKKTVDLVMRQTHVHGARRQCRGFFDERRR